VEHPAGRCGLAQCNPHNRDQLCSTACTTADLASPYDTARPARCRCPDQDVGELASLFGWTEKLATFGVPAVVGDALYEAAVATITGGGITTERTLPNVGRDQTGERAHLTRQPHLACGRVVTARTQSNIHRTPAPDLPSTVASRRTGGTDRRDIRGLMSSYWPERTHRGLGNLSPRRRGAAPHEQGDRQTSSHDSRSLRSADHVDRPKSPTLGRSGGKRCAPAGTRTQTVTILSRLPLPLGYGGASASVGRFKRRSCGCRACDSAAKPHSSVSTGSAAGSDAAVGFVAVLRGERSAGGPSA
jgi:hypothetical protein